VAGLEWLASKRFVVVQTLCAGFGVVLEQVVVGVADEIVF